MQHFSIVHFRCSLQMCRLLLVAAAAFCWRLGLTHGFELPQDQGAALFAKRCASCHGDNGQGVPDVYSEPLTGGRTVEQLAAYVDEFMPEGEPDAVSTEEANAVAAYMFSAFYSPEARAKLEPPRVPLSRLTNHQFKSAVADLFSGFYPPAIQDHEQGLNASFYAREMRKRRRGELVLERIDPNIEFEYGELSPDPERLAADEFSCVWEGGLIVQETGVYEFTLECRNGARLWINDSETPLIDASVRSGDVTLEKASPYLLGGRTYPIRAQLWKSREAKEKVAGIRLSWKRPLRTLEVVPQSAFTPHEQRPKPIVTINFPPDDRSTGFERATSISKDWDTAVTQAALQVGDWVIANREGLIGLGEDATKHAAAIETFAVQMGERAFRRALRDEEKQLLLTLVRQAPDQEAALRRLVLLTLKSPAFLYREVSAGDGDGFDQDDAAAWLAFALWDSVPDAALREAAAAGRLQDEKGLEVEAWRMLNDPRAKTKIRSVLHEWLKLDRMDDLSKDPHQFSGFNDQMKSDLRDSLNATLDELVWRGDSDLRTLFTSNQCYMSHALAEYYGCEISPAPMFRSGRFVTATFPQGQRAGVVTHPLLMAGFAYHAASSPIHRGVFLTRNVLGRVMRPPNIAIAPASPEQHPGLTTRERVTLQTSPEMCQGCHVTINSLGFALEHFGADGAYRGEEYGKPVDARGAYRTRQGELREFNGGAELAMFLAESEEVQQAFAKRVFQCMIKHPMEAFPPALSEKIQKRFAAKNFSIRDLMVSCAVASAHEMQRQSQAVPSVNAPIETNTVNNASVENASNDIDARIK